jgi:hypothetical protein
MLKHMARKHDIIAIIARLNEEQECSNLAVGGRSMPVPIVAAGP